MGKRPGVMLYFDTRPCLRRLTMDERGVLFEAILDYGEFGVVPELDGMVGVAWDFIRPKIDRDAEHYEEIAQKRTEAIRSRWERERQKNADTNEYKSIPTTTTTTKTTSSLSSASAPAPTPRRDGLSRELEFNERRKRALSMLDGVV